VDHCPVVVCISNKLKLIGNIKTSFFDVMSKVQKDSKDISTGIGNYFYRSDIYELCQEFDVKVDDVNFDLAWYN
jgi:hypothetical protein